LQCLNVEYAIVVSPFHTLVLVNTLPLPVVLLFHDFSFLRATLREPGLFGNVGFGVRFGAGKAAGREFNSIAFVATDDAIRPMIRQHLDRQKDFCNLIAMKAD